MKGIIERFKRNRDTDEEGMALAGVVMLAAFVFIICSSIAMTSMMSTNLTANNRSSLLVVSSADSGVDDAIVTASKGDCVPTYSNESLGYTYEVYRSAADTAPITTTDPGVSAGCPQNGDKFIVIHSKGTDYRGKETEVVSTYQWIIRSEGSVDGALVSGGGTMNLSRLIISGDGADLVLMSGTFDCNNITEVSGDLIVLGGTVAISNACIIKGSIYANNSVSIANPAVAVGGDIYTLGNFAISTGVTVGGSVYAKGNLTMSSGARINGSVMSESGATQSVDGVRIGGALRIAGPLRLQNGSNIGGNVVSSSTAAADVYNSTVGGSLTVGGNYSQLAATTVGGDITAARSGQVSSIAPTASAASVYLGGTINTWSSGPAVTGAVYQNRTIAAPAVATFTIPDQLTPNFFVWQDYSFLESDWTTSGYTIVTKASCDYQNNASLVTEVNNFTSPTVVDMRGCGNVNMYGVTFTLKTDVAFVSNKFANAEQVKVNSSSAATHEFDMIISDLVPNSAPTCSAGQGVMDIYGLRMSDKISGFIYSPCQITFGGNSIINGQVYSGSASYTSGGDMKINYIKSGVPGFPTDTGTEVTNYDASATERATPLLVARQES